MALESVRKSPIPPRDAWLAARSDIISKMSEQDLLRLYKGVAERDMTVIRINGELERVLRVANIQVFYQSGDKRYKLRESRYTVMQGRDPEETLTQVLTGDMSGVVPSAPRPNRNSLSERMKLDGETREDATLRAIHEEMFDDAIRRSGKTYPELDQVLVANLIYSSPTLLKVDANAEGSSFKGLPARYFLFPASITFTPDMDTPIDLKDGVPQKLITPEEGKYINIYDWDEIPTGS